MSGSPTARRLIPAGREDVPVEQRRGHRQDVGHVVEAEVRVVGRQQAARVDLQREQVADGVGVLPPIQSVDGGAARIGSRSRSPVQGVLQRGGDGFIRGRVGSPPAGRRHRAGAQLAHDLLPGIGMIADARGVHGVQRKSGRAQPLVVAADAIAVQDRAHGPAGRHALRNGRPLLRWERDWGGCGQRFARRGRALRTGVHIERTEAGRHDADSDDAGCQGLRHRPTLGFVTRSRSIRIPSGRTSSPAERIA